MRHRRTTGNCSVTIQTGSTYICDSMTDIITIPTANLLSGRVRRKSTGYHQRQQEIATWLPKPEIVISLELQLIASKFQRQVGYFWPLRVRIMCPRSYCDNVRQPEMALRPTKPEILISLEPRQVGRQFRQQIWDFRSCPARRNWPRVIATTIDNRK